MGAKVKGRLLSAGDRRAALGHLEATSRLNLPLLDAIHQVGQPPAPHEVPAQVLGAWSGPRLVGLAALRPSLILESALCESALEAFWPFIDRMETGLVKSARDAVDALWEHLERAGRRAVLDRLERVHLVEAGKHRPAAVPAGAVVRHAELRDWEALVTAARASLREEQRPDPFEGDPTGFRLWVRGRIRRARVVEVDGRVVFVGYADVRRPQGWLVQGVYTWPEFRRRGFAAAGMTALIDEAVASGADHVQLAVVHGNEPALGLYRRLGFEPGAWLRTILFA
ncbi:MAG: GNAT family N-acetyltransferase [Myxococcota bacterium]